MNILDNSLFDYEEVMGEISPNWEEELTNTQIASGSSVFTKALHDLANDNKTLLQVKWPLFTEKFGGFRGGELTSLTGDTGHGKTTWATNIVYLLMRNKIPTAVFSLEMGPEALIKKIFRMRQKAPFDITSGMRCHEEFKLFCMKTLWLYTGQSYISFEVFKTMLAWAAINKGCKFILLDHFEMVTEPHLNAYELGRIVADIRALAHKLGIHIMIIVHPAKIKGDSKERLIQMDDIKGSTGIKQFSDNVMSVFFNKEEKVTTVKMHKIRDDDYGRFMGDQIKYVLDTQNLIFQECRYE